MSTMHKGNLPRLEKHRYQGHAVVFWTNTLEERTRGWRTPAFHAAFRELMLHAAARERLSRVSVSTHSPTRCGRSW